MPGKALIMQHAEPERAEAEAKAGPTLATDASAGALWTGIGFARSCNDPGEVGILANRFLMSSRPCGDDVLFDSTVLDSSSSFFQSGSLNLVPEPHTALLFGMGLMFLGVRQRCPHSHPPDRFFGKGN